MTVLGSSKAPPDASRQTSPLAPLLACSHATRQLLVSHVTDCAALRLACKDGRELVDGAISAPCHLTANGSGWLHRVLGLLTTLAERWPLRSELLLVAKGELRLVLSHAANAQAQPCYAGPQNHHCNCTAIFNLLLYAQRCLRRLDEDEVQSLKTSTHLRGECRLAPPNDVVPSHITLTLHTAHPAINLPVPIHHPLLCSPRMPTVPTRPCCCTA